MHPAIRSILGRRLRSVVLATRHSPGATGRECFSRLYLGFEDGHQYEIWIHATDQLHGAKGLDRETGLDRVRLQTCEGGNLEAHFLDPAEQAEADRLMASAAFFRLLREEHLRPEALRGLAAWYRDHQIDPRPRYLDALDRLHPADRRRAPGVEILG